MTVCSTQQSAASTHGSRRPRILHLLHQLPVCCVLLSQHSEEASGSRCWALRDRLAGHKALHSGMRALGEDYEHLYIGTLGPVLIDDEIGGRPVDFGANASTSTLPPHPLDDFINANASSHLQTNNTTTLGDTHAMASVDTTLPTDNTNISVDNREIAVLPLLMPLPSQPNFMSPAPPISVPPRNPLEDPDSRQAIVDELRARHKCVPVFVSERDWLRHYEGYCKQTLWSLFHYILNDVVTDGRKENLDWDAYTRVNAAFAKTAVEHYLPGDLIWIQDYHLLLTPQMLRAELRPQEAEAAVIGLFLHTPFPSSEIFRSLARRRETLTGMLGATLIGFQIYSYARHFLSSCTRVLGLETTLTTVETGSAGFKNPTVTVGVFPVGIDVKSAESLLALPEVAAEVELLRSTYSGKRLLVGHDKLDNNRGVYQKLLAFQRLLAKYPYLRDNVVLVQVSTPSQQENSRLESKVAELVSQINGDYGTTSHMPVVYIKRRLAPAQFCAALSVADVGVITPVRDGMNTTAQEFVVFQRHKMSPLVLSEFTGSAGSLPAAILVNPWDPESVAVALHDALVMSAEERAQRHRHASDYFRKFNSSTWVHKYVAALMAAGERAQLAAFPEHTPLLERDACAASYARASARLILLDYDGTLAPIVRHPDAAAPSRQVKELLARLCADSRNCVYVVSGRDKMRLAEWLGDVPQLGLVAEHGCFLRRRDSAGWIDYSANVDMSWKPDVVEVFNYYTERTQGAFVEIKQSSVTWHFRQADPDFGEFQAKECQNHLESSLLGRLPVELLVGKKNLEVRPCAINKGEAARVLLSDRTYDFCLVAGDDRTDEDMFRAIMQHQPSAKTPLTVGERIDMAKWTVGVGASSRRTTAEWHVPQPDTLLRVLNCCADSA